MIELSAIEARVVGALLEKEATTPDQYPLSLNALVNACNQKSNRHPVMQLNDSQVQEALDSLEERHLISIVTGFGSRVQKIQHRFCNSQFSALQLGDQEVAILCVLLLRGPQTPGELRSRTSRMCTFDDVAQVSFALNGLIKHEKGPLVRMLNREAGKRESRFEQLFCAEEGQCVTAGEGVVTTTTLEPSLKGHNLEVSGAGCTDKSLAERVDCLEAECAELKAEVQSLKEMVELLMQ